MPVPPEHIKDCLKYDPDTGIFTWLISTRSYAGKINPGDAAGSQKLETTQGYIMIGFEQKIYRAHRLAFWFMTGEMPPRGADIDHADGDRSNNRWANLRLATRAQNNWNNHNRRSDNVSGHVGVSWHDQTQKWLARITVDKKIIHLGIHSELSQAVAARREAEQRYCGQFLPKGG